MEDVMTPRGSHEIMEALTAEDFETASIRSAAPSYRSEAPTLHYTVPHTNGSLLPPYTAPPATPGRQRSMVPHGTAAITGPRRGAPIPHNGNAFGNARGGNVPNLGQFRIPSWSTISTSPNARLYHSVALRRVAAAEHASAAAEIGGLMRRLAVVERMEQEEAAASRRMAEAAANRRAAAAAAAADNGAGRSAPAPATPARTNNSSSSNNSNNNNNNNDMWRNDGTFRPLEDPYLVGESAARRARSERVTRENQAHAEEALAREDRRWDWFLGQVRNRQATSFGAHSRLRRRMDSSVLAPVVSLRHSRSRRV